MDTLTLLGVIPVVTTIITASVTDITAPRLSRCCPISMIVHIELLACLFLKAIVLLLQMYSLTHSLTHSLNLSLDSLFSPLCIWGFVQACSECGFLKYTGVRSCCANGGAWFDKCGNPGNSNFEHTWFDGIQACAGRVRSFSRDANLQSMSRQDIAITQLKDTLSKQNVISQATINNKSDIHNSDCAVYNRFTSIVILTNIFINVLNRFDSIH